MATASRCSLRRQPARYGTATTAGETWNEIFTGLAPISKGAHYESFVKVPA